MHYEFDNENDTEETVYSTVSEHENKVGDKIGDKASRLRVLSSEELRRQQTEGRAGARQRQKLLGSTMKELHRLQKQASSLQSTALRGDSYSSTATSRSSGSSGGGGSSSHSGGGGGGAVNLFPTGRAVDAVLLVGGATRIPCVRRTVRTVTGVDALSSRTVNPDEAVCLGAGILAGMLDGLIPDMQVLSPWQAAVLRVVHEEKLKGDVLLPLKVAPVEEGNNNAADNELASSSRTRKFPSRRRIA